MYKQDKYDIQAEAEGNRVFAEAIEVANEFARQTGTRYHRTITDWSIRSDFDRAWFDDKGFHYMHSPKAVKFDVRKYEYSDPVELAWKLEDEWNKRVEGWTKALNELDKLDSIYEIERREDVIDSDVSAGLDSMAELVEIWLDSIECFYFGGGYANELREEVA